MRPAAGEVPDDGGHVSESTGVHELLGAKLSRERQRADGHVHRGHPRTGRHGYLDG